MIEIHNFHGDSPSSTDDFDTSTRWGIIEGGNIKSINQHNQPNDRTFKEFLGYLQQTIPEGIIDPVAVTEELRHGSIRAVVPAAQQDDIFTGDQPWRIISDGYLHPVEKYEANKYMENPNTSSTRPIKEHETDQNYELVLVNIRQIEEGDTYIPIGAIHLDSKKSMLMNEEYEDTFDDLMETLKKHAPTLNPVSILEMNTKTRVCTVVDPDTEMNYKDQSEILRDRQEIIADINGQIKEPT